MIGEKKVKLVAMALMDVKGLVDQMATRANLVSYPPSEACRAFKEFLATQVR